MSEMKVRDDDPEILKHPKLQPLIKQLNDIVPPQVPPI